MQKSTLVPLALAVLAGVGSAQSWEQLIAQRWPEATIRKVSEKEFERFVVQHAGRLDKSAAFDVFLTAQYRAYGLQTDSGYAKQFLVPSDGKGVRSGLARENLVLEGAEPNGDPGTGGTPTPFACGDQGDGAVQVGGDEDWWAITLAGNSHVLATTGPGLSGPGLPGAIPDTVLEIYDSAGALVAVNDDYTVQSTAETDRGAYSQIEINLAAGSYFCSVRGFSNTEVGNYTLDLQCSSPKAIIPEGPEPNGDPAQGGTPTPIAIGQIAEGEVSVAGDLDWFTLTIGAQSDLLFETGISGFRGGHLGDSMLAIFDAANGLNIAADDDGGPGAYSQIPISLAPETYWVEVRGFGTEFGSYRLWIKDVTVPSSSVGEAPEPNNDPTLGGAPTLMACNQVGVGDISLGGSAGDADWWQFTLTGEVYVVGRTLPDTSSAGINDTTLTLRDSSGAQIAFNDDGGFGLYSEVAIYLTAGTYYFDVQGFGAADVGGYQLAVECDRGTPAHFQELGGGCLGSSGIPTVSARTYELPVIGTTFTVDFTNCPANGLVIAFVGFSNQTSTSGIALPLDLGFAGAPGCALEADPLASANLPTDSLGAATFPVPLPMAASVVGVKLYYQGFTIDFGNNALNLAASTVGVAIIGDRY